MNTTLVVLVLAITGALYLPWRLVRDGYKELVQMCLAAVYAVLVNLDTPHPFMPMFIAVTAFGAAFVADCALSLWLYQRKANAKTANH